ncbi:hypothetical protein EDB84DRAFT_1566798 [Lactarius hengduanensis]|nr:hypothetical protein EDB84DRAFT_1566798 [Lactarius hengduanensis]
MRGVRAVAAKFTLHSLRCTTRRTNHKSTTAQLRHYDTPLLSPGPMATRPASYSHSETAATSPEAENLSQVLREEAVRLIQDASGGIVLKPTLNNSHVYHQTLHDIKKRGIDVEGVKLNLQQMLKAKEDSVNGLTKGIEILFKQNKVDYIKGTASFVSPKIISVQLNDSGKSTVEAKNVIIATGSEVAPFPGGAIEIDEQQIVSSTEGGEGEDAEKAAMTQRARARGQSGGDLGQEAGGNGNDAEARAGGGRGDAERAKCRRLQRRQRRRRRRGADDCSDDNADCGNKGADDDNNDADDGSEDAGDDDDDADGGDIVDSRDC